MFLRRRNFLIVFTTALSTYTLFSCESRTSHREGDKIDSINWPSSFGFGRTASLKEIDSLNIDVAPNGDGLPAGSGNVPEGRKIYAEKCSRCHGRTGTEGPFNKLVVLNDLKDSLQRAEKVIGNYWPYATTVYDYIHRAMPYDSPGTLSPDEVYSLTAFLLYRNNIIDSAITIDSKSLPQVVMPAKDRFVNDDRKGGPEIR